MEEPKTAKVPEGMNIEAPKVEQKDRPVRSGLHIPEYELDAGLPTIVYPHYINNAKSLLACILIRPDGVAVREDQIPRDDKHPLYRDIKAQFTEQEIDHNTSREMSNQKAKQRSQEDQEKETKRQATRADLWNKKSTFLDMPLVRNTKYKSLKRKLRQATNPEEALAYGVAIIIKETEVDEE